MMAADGVALPLCAVLAISLVAPASTLNPVWVALLALVGGIVSLRATGFYRSVVRFMGLELIVAAFKSVTFTAAILMLWIAVAESWAFAARPSTAFWLLALVYVAGSRTIARSMLESRHIASDRVLIYGAGDAGAHLASAIGRRGEFTLVAFVDDNPALQGAVINGLPVHAPSSLKLLIEEFGISRVLLAMPSITRRRRQKIINRLEQVPVHVQTMPDFNDLISGNARVDDIREVDIADLLGRDVVPPVPDLLGACITGRSVMVTGAGGSIGSELCLQILRLAPKRLILLELSEAALYKIDQKLQDIAKQKALDIEIVSLIGSAHHQGRVTEVLKVYRVDTVYHAAAYKHVPLVEQNMLEGVHNNVFGTLHTAEAAIAAGVEFFVLISTDKAVKPTNVMGATKRFAELVLQGLNQRGAKTRFSMVRFGNVLASSGSVVPLFREQILRGGPVTVTHPDIYRYFMTIPEAASLVLQAGSMGEGGEVFVLDMGEPVRIADLAEKLIHLMGLTVRGKDDLDGDIEIEYTGLRPAEKLYEELLIGDNVTGTAHPRILRAQEDFIPWNQLKPVLDELYRASADLDCEKARAILLQGVVGYAPTKEVEDLVWRERNRNLAAAKKIVASGGNVTPLEPRRVSPNADRIA
jgi:FlaA1/EpsC-like NDP-sugar epimerase